MRGDTYQKVLIGLGVATTALFGVFLYRELFPEYKIYQHDYVALEEFRSTYTGEPAPAFKYGVKQIVQLKENKGPPVIDRCTSCHVALEFSHFSPTKVNYDINGNIDYNADGFPVLVKNENYVWDKLNEKIEELRNEAVNAQLEMEGKGSEVKKRLRLADQYEGLKTTSVGHHTYDMEKVLRMHPLMGRETRPFEYHPLEEYGCTSCHSGNGNGLTTEKAHGPVFDGQYETEFMGYVPKFTESDPANDPKFASVFNHKPGHELLFQTTPILVGNLIQARCIQCHKTSTTVLEDLYNTANSATTRRQQRSSAIITAYNDDVEALISLLTLQALIKKEGVEGAIVVLQQTDSDATLPALTHEKLNFQIRYLKNYIGKSKDVINNALEKQLLGLTGSKSLLEKITTELAAKNSDATSTINAFVQKFRTTPEATGSLFAKADAVNLEKELIQHAQDTEQSFAQATNDPTAMKAMASDIDLLTHALQNGQNLFLSQACYACHRIAGLSRGGIGPELSQEGKKYPWFIKESIVWPQADVKTSTMPNFHLDHEEVEALMTFLLSQTGQRKSDSETGTRVALQEWEAGKKLPWEKSISPSRIDDLNYSMEVFAVEGCAACHRLKGFESNVGFRIEKDKNKPSFDTLYKEHEWFKTLFPEEIPGSELVNAIDAHKTEIDMHLADGVRKDALIEEIEKKHPGTIKGLYSNFKYASRAKNNYYNTLILKEKDPSKKAVYKKELKEWKTRVNRVLMVYIQEYGLGRLIGPRPNWSGVYRSDEWLMEHFKNPGAHVARSIMPVFPFDDTKFYALTKMLDVLGIRNRNAVREIWKNNGFNPEEAYGIHCAQCHGNYLQGNGPVAEWIYPIPKNLRNSDFLINLTRQKAYNSIVHGVLGTPMPPWGEIGDDKPSADGIPVLTKNEIHQLVDWIYSSLPGENIPGTTNEIQKWKYSPQDVIEELKLEGNQLKAPPLSTLLPRSNETRYAALEPSLKQEIPSALSEYFTVSPNPYGGEEKNFYYIKKEYYTPQNLQKGKELFELNCAACHGKDADGSGLRATAMTDAKPRMLTNLDWINSHDDLRLLRSIKYGVLGTSMTPWGDLTNAAQRMQLVMFIRSLSEETTLRSELLSILYKTYTVAEQSVEKARGEEYKKIEAVKKESLSLREQLVRLDKDIENGKATPAAATDLYQKLMLLKQQQHQLEERDALLQNLIKSIRSERDRNRELGLTLISKRNENLDISPFFTMVKSNEGKFSLEEGKITIVNDPQRQESFNVAANALETSIKSTKENLEKQKVVLEGKVSSAALTEQMQSLNNEIIAIEKLNALLLFSIEEAKRTEEQQKQLIDTFNASGIKA